MKDIAIHPLSYPDSLDIRDTEAEAYELCRAWAEKARYWLRKGRSRSDKINKAKKIHTTVQCEKRESLEAQQAREEAQRQVALRARIRTGNEAHFCKKWNEKYSYIVTEYIRVYKHGSLQKLERFVLETTCWNAATRLV